MNLDVNTLFLVTIYVEAMLGLLLLFAWVQNSAITAVAWWGSRASAARLLGRAVRHVWLRARLDLHRPVECRSCSPPSPSPGPARACSTAARPASSDCLAARCCGLWSAAFPFIAHSLEARILISSFIITGYTWAAAYEFWRGRSEPLVSRWPAIFMLFAHGVAVSAAHAAVDRAALDAGFAGVRQRVANGAVFEALLFTIAIAFILLAMAKERTELLHKTAAMVDPLTGIPNRRAFLEGGAQHGAPHRCRSAAGGGAADRSRSFQIDQRFVRSCARRPRAAGLCRNRDLPISALTTCSAGWAARNSRSRSTTSIRDRAMDIAETIRQAFADIASDVDGQPVDGDLQHRRVGERGGAARHLVAARRRPTRRSIRPRNAAATVAS